MEGTWKESVALKSVERPSNLTWDTLLKKKRITAFKKVGIIIPI